MTDYWKYHGLGNDYLVIEPEVFCSPITPEMALKICERHSGIGADGIMLGPLLAQGEQSAVRILNPDGSEAEKSGNGLRIFARHLWERGHVRQRRFTIQTLGGLVQAELLDAAGQRIRLEMGPVRFTSADIPMSGAAREVLREPLEVLGEVLTISAANVGNPHCVVHMEPGVDESAALAHALGPAIENHPSFPQRTNVQFMSVLEPQRISIQIWERGAGYTQASGSSSCAAAAVACRLGLCRTPVTVLTPGGALLVQLTKDFHASLEAPVTAVGSGVFADEFLAALALQRRRG